MDTTVESAPAKIESPQVSETKWTYLKTSDEVTEYLAKHLTPVRYGPKGQPIYALEDIEALNVVFPED